MSEVGKRRPVTHKHPCIAAAIHVLKDVGGGPLPAVVIFRRAHDQGLLAATAYHTLRGRLSHHQRASQVVVVKTDAGYMLAAEGVPGDTPKAACAPNRPPLPEAIQADPLAVMPSLRPRRRRAVPSATRVRDLSVTPEWLAARSAPRDVLKWVRLRRWQSQWRQEYHPTAGDLLTGWLPVTVARWFIAALPLEESLKRRLREASGQAERTRVLAEIEKPSRRRRPAADKAVEEVVDVEPNGATR